ncbi:hypothetical protein [Spirosoma daeguense]
MKKLFFTLVAVGSFWSCQTASETATPTPLMASSQELPATILRFNASKHYCGFSWLIQIDKEEYRVYGLENSVPKDYQKENLPVWITYQGDPSRQGCNTIILSSIRAR